MCTAAVLCPSLLATTPATSQSTTKSFASDEYRFRLDYPADWVTPEHPVNGQVFSVRTPPADKADEHFAVFGLRIDAGPDNSTDAEILKDISGTAVNVLFNNGAKKIFLKSDRVGDIPARRVTFLNEHKEGNTKTMYVFAVKGRSEYVFTVAAPEKQFDQVLPQVDAMLKSFQAAE